MESQQQVPPGIVALAHKTLQPSPTRFTEHPDYDIWVTNSFRQNYFVHTISVDGKEYSVGDEITWGSKKLNHSIKSFEWKPDTGLWQMWIDKASCISCYSDDHDILKITPPPSQQDRSVSQPGMEMPKEMMDKLRELGKDIDKIDWEEHYDSGHYPEKPDWKGAFLSMQDAFILTHKELTALKSRPSEGWSEAPFLKDFTHWLGVKKYPITGFVHLKEFLDEYKLKSQTELK